MIINSENTRCLICVKAEPNCTIEGCCESNLIKICTSCGEDAESLSDREMCETCEEEMIESDSVKGHREE